MFENYYLIEQRMFAAVLLWLATPVLNSKGTEHCAVLRQLRAQDHWLKAKYHRRYNSKSHCICHQKAYNLIAKISPRHGKYSRVSKSGMTNVLCMPPPPCPHH